MAPNGARVMKELAWEECQYYSSGHCPQHQAIDKAYLIPQLLEPSQMKDAREICAACEKYLHEKRKYRRIKRPLKVVVTNKELKKRIEGTIVDASINGALVKLNKWINFNKDEIVKLQLYTEDKNQNKAKADIINIYGTIKRLVKEKQELVIIFLKEESVKKCANI